MPEDPPSPKPPAGTPTRAAKPSAPRKPRSASLVGRLGAMQDVQAQAEQRVQLGMKLFKAAEARIAAQHDVLAEVKAQQAQLREAIQNDVASSLQSYDQWMGKIDESFTGAIRDVTARLDRLESEFVDKLTAVEALASRAEQLLESARLTEPAEDLPTHAPLSPPEAPEAEPQPIMPEENEAAVPQHDTDQAVFLRVLNQLRRDDDAAAA